jgi:hypothetical protein
MSYSSPQFYPAVEGVRQAEPKARSAAAISRHLQRAHDGYTLTHGGHQVRIGPVAFWIVVGALVIMAVWSIATGTYFAFRDNVLTRLMGRQTEMQFAYEDRIAELRAQVDRIMSRQLLDQEQFKKKLNTLLQRQATLEQRTAALTGDPSTTGTIKPARTAPTAIVPAEKPARVRPIGDTVIFVAPQIVKRGCNLANWRQPQPALPKAPRRAALVACWLVFRCRSTRSSKNKLPPSPTLRSASTRDRAGCRACWLTLELPPVACRPRERPADRSFRSSRRKAVPVRSSGSFTAFTWPARKSTGIGRR